ncbi:MAG: hypothetical protein SFT94_10110, partial [Pseudanabaenaceae cyanobacterium bins.68]|nr:hypothetical protein [Pseudanabaenaceae cyanobacterium bins.68]
PIPVDFAEPNEPSNLGPSEHITEIPSQLSEDLPESVAELSPDLSLDSGAGFAPDLEEVSTSLSESVSEIEELPTSEPGVEDAADELDMFEAELESSPIAGFTEILTTTQPDPELPSDYTQIITSSVPEELPSDYTQIADSSQPAEVPDQKPTLDQAIASEPQFAEAVGEGNPFGKFILPGIIALIVAIGGIFALSPKKSDTPPPQNTQQGR